MDFRGRCRSKWQLEPTTAQVVKRHFYNVIKNRLEGERTRQAEKMGGRVGRVELSRNVVAAYVKVISRLPSLFYSSFHRVN